MSTKPGADPLPAHDDEVSPSVSLERFVRSHVAVSAMAIQRGQVDRLLAALDDDDLQLLWLLEGQGMTHAEAGEVLGLKPDSVKKRLQRLRNRVRGEADDLGLDDQPGAHPRMY
jgi:DNA-directed RNA polymerase specialized sigma24 family protein